jgi:hypothetical protein
MGFVKACTSESILHMRCHVNPETIGSLETEAKFWSITFYLLNTSCELPNRGNNFQDIKQEYQSPYPENFEL